MARHLSRALTLAILLAAAPGLAQTNRVGPLQSQNNLADLSSIATARVNLGLGPDVAFVDATQSWTRAQRNVPVALSFAGTIAADFAASNNFVVTMAGNATLANPANIAAGQAGQIVVNQDATGNRTLAFGSVWKFPAGISPTLTTAANAADVLSYYVLDSSRIAVVAITNLK